MSKYPATPEVGYELPVPGTLQPWETIDFNTLFTQTETAIHTDRGRLGALETATANAVIPSGSTAARDAFWGVPATATDRVALASKPARWFNTTLGQEQQYFAAAGDAGATAVNVKFTGGWYPPINGNGETLVIPTVSGAGAALAQQGLVNLTAWTSAAPIVLDHIFDQGFEDVRIVVDGEVSGGTGITAMTFQLRTSATVPASDATANYWEVTLGNANGVVGGAQAFSSTNTQLMAQAAAAAFSTDAVFYRAGAAQVTRFMSHSHVFSTIAANGFGMGLIDGGHGAHTAWGGVALSMGGTGTVTGTIKCYGRNNG